MAELQNSILIVEDCEINAEMLCHILGDKYILHTARDGKEGIEKARSLLPDLVILDIILPLMDGYEVITELKAHSETRDIPIIFVTALNNPEDERKGLMLGGSDYINKPYDSVIVKLRVKNQIQIINQLRTIELLSKEIKTWMNSENE